MKTARRPLTRILLVLAVGVALLPAAGLAAQDAPTAPPSATAVAKQAVEATEVAPPTMSPKEKTGVYVFLAWTWMTIAILLYILTLKVREADRVLRTGLFGPPGGGKEPREHL
jgi:hypothetical protein